MKNYHVLVKNLRDEMVARRRDLHQHPELAFQEIRTAGMIATALGELGLEVQTGVGQTGVVGILEGSADGPTVLVRCDMDALPIHEESDAPYRSQTDGQMHACGHDGHVTIALAVAKLLNMQRDDLHGRVKFIFQPAEEIGRGARAMLDDGVLSDPVPDVALGLHLWPDNPVGEVLIGGGPVMTGAALFRITLHGKGGHAAQPDGAIDPILVAAHLTTALQSIVSRNLDPREAASVSVTRIEAGSAYNIIPERAELYGTFRTFTQTARDVVVSRLETLVPQLAEGFGCRAEIDIQEPVPPLVNAPNVAEHLRERLNKHVPDFRYLPEQQAMASEDMALFLQQIPGVYMFVGCGFDDAAQTYPLHHPKYDLNEDALVVGASVLASAVSEYVMS